ncbi:hypothetical protein RhiirB3_129688 [Rhizophagus irregularis]|nr:hypothetical protein RhiirB3_129688 [Rhizophagus irregularis]
MEFLFGEIKPPSNSTSINKGIIKLAEFTKGSLDLIINSYGYVDGLETYGVLIYGNEIKIFSMDLTFDGLYRYNQLSKILLPTENANFLNIITVISTFYSLLVRVLLYSSNKLLCCLITNYFYYVGKDKIHHCNYEFISTIIILWSLVLSKVEFVT